MPKKVNGSPTEREQWMKELFQSFYSNPENKGKNLSVGKANEAFKAQFGSMLRNKRAYEVRDQVLVAMGLKAAPTPASVSEPAPAGNQPA